MTYTMTTFYKLALALRTGYRAIKAIAGIIVITHALWRWFGRRVAPAKP